ncbi:MAG: L-histidine N(alpha)-methyltransferase [Bacteroidetes bacterium]|nr:MAG: L-histidine N(alpha)-methyltransferase [Bacteroidota bacterium]
MEQSFAEDVLHGLSSTQKRLPSKYFYDNRGSKIFVEIMGMPEYYLTGCEQEIFSQHAKDIAELSWKPGLQIVELGAGDGLKTMQLLKAFASLKKEVEYVPIDISEGAVNLLLKRMKKELPKQKVNPKVGEYFQALEEMLHDSDKPKLILFLGSNIGNYSQQDAQVFLKRLNRNLLAGDQVLIGVDLKKSPSLILPAYSDNKGITARFNLNLLKRINRELGANFNLRRFRHYASYDPDTGEVRSYLISKVEQEVYIEKLNKSFQLAKMESIHTEISKKYAIDEFDELASHCGYSTKEQFFDSRHFFMDALWEKSGEL